MTMKAFQRCEDAVIVFSIDSAAIVTDREPIQVRLCLLDREANPRNDVRPGILDAVPTIF
jgi:hypothetical protein